MANCHKIPAGDFERRRLSVTELAEALLPVFEKLRQELPNLEIIATVSPVRHLRDGLVENQRSKATLLLALDEICQRLPFAHYFPAYEILLDDLRDYRFYADDLAHPNQLATDYIWQYFEGAFFDEKTQALCGRIERVLTALAHRPFHPQSAEHQYFVKKQTGIVKELSAEFPHLDFGQELLKLAVF
ncbi:MAG: GSCFA domain-containing protein [Saprospiraceae bacterium]|nr:GSCFA domain-containing protein [Saprospiraceae bacterium]